VLQKTNTDLYKKLTELVADDKFIKAISLITSVQNMNKLLHNNKRNFNTSNLAFIILIFLIT